MNQRIVASVLMAGVCGLAFGGPAFAQGAASEADDANTIIVTAQNRAENVQDVPIAISVITSEAVQKAGVTDFSGVERVAPSVQIVNDTVLTRVTVRGVGTNDNAETQDQSIAVNVDGEYLNRPTVLNASLFDLDRVEVLRGPQGTLYGRNATGGAINFITRKPGSEFGVNATASYGNYDAVVLQGGIDIPLGDIGGFRVAGIYSNRDGYNYHPNVDKRSGDDNTRGGRVSLRLKPTDALTADLAVEYVKIDTVPADQAFANLNDPARQPGAGCANNGWAEVAPLTPGTQCIPLNTNFLSGVDRRSYNAPATGVGDNHQESTAVRGRLAYDFGPATLTYTGGYRTTTQVGDTVLSPAFVFKGFQSDVDTHSHELRLNGDTDGGFIWQFGGFYFNEKQRIDRGLFLPVLGPNGGYVTYFSRPKVATESWAMFGQADIPLAEKLTAVIGARFTKDDRSAIFDNYGFNFNTGPVRLSQIRAATSRQLLDSKAEKFTWLVGLNYKPDDDTLVYAKVSTGFKAGGFDSKGDYKPETNTAYEAGLKKNFGASGEHKFNLAGFYYNYKDLQAAVLLDSTIGAQVFNAGKATIWGIEAEAAIKLSDNDRFSASVNYLHAEYDEFLASYTVFGGGVGDLDNDPNTITQPNFAGNSPPQSPRWIITAGYDHIFDMGGSGTLTASVFTRFKSSYFLDIFNYRDSQEEAYTQTDISLEYRPEDDKFGVQLFARNLENKRPLTYAAFVSAGSDNIYNWQFGAPRTYGVRLLVDF